MSELSGKTILVADDAPDNRLLVAKILNLAGAKVEFAENGEEAVDMALNGSIDAVLMDVQMPILDGLEATAELRKRGFMRPIIALTAHTSSEERARCLAAGCNDHLAKPLNRTMLVGKIQALTSNT